MMKCLRIALFGAALLIFAASNVRADADADWKAIEAMETNAPASQWNTPEEARTGAIEYLREQQGSINAFIKTYPNDPRVFDAKLRLAHLLATLGDMTQDPAGRSDAQALLDQLEEDPAMKDRRADVEFARLSLFMQRADAAGSSREALLGKTRAFAKDFPNDHRLAALLAEVASAFDDQPRTARVLLEQAQPLADTPELRERIADDLKRLSMVGKPFQMRWTAVDGRRVDLDRLQGRVVLIYFFANWSAPSMYQLDWVKSLRGGSESIVILGVCLDKDPTSVPGMLAGHDINWPVYCDGDGWEGQMVRSLGINSLPALWIVGTDGTLLTVDAKDDAPAIIEKAAPIGDSGQ